MYQVVDDEQVTAQLAGFPIVALAAYAELRAALEVAPWTGESVAAANPDGPVRSMVFGADRVGLAVYLILDAQRRVGVVQVSWVG